MHCHVIIFLFSSWRFQLQIYTLLPYPTTYWTCFWIHSPTGPLSVGAFDSTLFWKRLSAIYSENLYGCYEMLPFILHSLQCNTTFSTFRTTSVQLCCLFSWPRFETGKSYLSTLRSMQISLGLPDPREQSSLSILKRVQAGEYELLKARLLVSDSP